MQSDLKKVIDNADKNFPKDKIVGNGRILPYVIVGDDAFPLQKHIMKPYSHKTNVKERQVFNLRLSRARHVVEQAFGILSNRFQIFQNKINLSVEKVELVTKTCCVLHNLLSQRNEDYMEFTQFKLPTITDQSNSIPETINQRSAPQRIRRGFEEYFNKEGKLTWLESKL